MAQVSFEDFQRIEMRVGRIARVEGFPKAQAPAYKLWIDFGEHGVKKSSAKITALYSKEQLMGSQVVAVTNFAPRQVGDFMSEVLVLGFVTSETDVVLLQPEREVPLGARVA